MTEDDASVGDTPDPSRARIAMLAELLRDEYRLPECSIVPISRGAMNHCYRVESGDRVFCLKDYDTRLYQVDQIARAGELQGVARRAGVPTPETILNTAGCPVTETADGFLSLSDFVAGRTYTRPSIPARAARNMGRALGDIHKAFREVEPEESYKLRDPSTARDILDRTLAVAEPHRGRSREDEIACQVLRHRLASLERLAYLAPELARLRTQLTHGDYQEANVLFNEREALVAVLDFDGCRQQPRGAELTRAISLCFLEGETLVPQAWDFVAGYAEVGRMPEAEVRLLAPLRAYLAATGAWPIEDRYLAPERYQPRWDRFIRPPSGWWEENQEWVTERLLESSRRISDRPHWHRPLLTLPAGDLQDS